MHLNTRWGIFVHPDAKDIQSVSDLKGKTVGISRFGSGSHLMSFVLADQVSSYRSGYIYLHISPFGMEFYYNVPDRSYIIYICI